MSPSVSAAPRGLSAVNGTMPAWFERADRQSVVAFVDSCLRGVGQVVFMNNPVTGLAILVAMALAEPWLAVAGVIGLVASTLTAIVLGLDRSAVRAGLFGFNGVLVGAGLSLFMGPDWDVLVMVWIAAGGALSTVLHATLATIFVGAFKVPPFTLAFNFVTLIFLVAALNLANGRLSPLVAPGSPEAAGDRVSTALRAAPDAASANDVEGVLNAILRGIGQLFFANDIVAGIVIVAGIAVCSRIAAGFALVGSSVGMLTGLALGADGTAIYNGLWGFNSFDAALAIGGVFYVLTWRSGLFAVACAFFTALLFGALAALFTPWGLPALTLPFCLGTLAFVVMKYTSSQLVPIEVADITTPEEHLRRRRGQHSEGVGRDATREFSASALADDPRRER